jgi:hypothetical protein
MIILILNLSLMNKHLSMNLIHQKGKQQIKRQNNNGHMYVSKCKCDQHRHKQIKNNNIEQPTHHQHQTNETQFNIVNIDLYICCIVNCFC